MKDDVPKTTLVAIRSLVDRFDSSISIQITNRHITETRAINSGFFRRSIVLSRRLFERSVNSVSQFNDQDIMAIVGHELGHIIPTNFFIWLVYLISTMIMAAIVGFLYFAFFKPLFSFVFLIFGGVLVACLAYLNHQEEYQADRFAVKEADIPIKEFIQCLEKLHLVFMQEVPLKQRRSLVRKVFRPTIEQRIFHISDPSINGFQ